MPCSTETPARKESASLKCHCCEAEKPCFRQLLPRNWERDPDLLKLSPSLMTCWFFHQDLRSPEPVQSLHLLFSFAFVSLPSLSFRKDLILQPKLTWNSLFSQTGWSYFFLHLLCARIIDAWLLHSSELQGHCVSNSFALTSC